MPTSVGSMRNRRRMRGMADAPATGVITRGTREKSRMCSHVHYYAKAVRDVKSNLTDYGWHCSPLTFPHSLFPTLFPTHGWHFFSPSFSLLLGWHFSFPFPSRTPLFPL